MTKTSPWWRVRRTIVRAPTNALPSEGDEAHVAPYLSGGSLWRPRAPKEEDPPS